MTSTRLDRQWSEGLEKPDPQLITPRANSEMSRASRVGRFP